MPPRLNSTGKDAQVERALFRRAVGYEYQEDTFSVESESGEAVLVKRVVKHERPDISAIKFWLENRLPEKWGGSAGPEESGGVVVLPEIKK